MDDKKYCIYVVVNKQNGKVYIGKTGNGLLIRWKEHWRAANSLAKSISNYFWRSLRKGGPQNFDICRIDEAESLEESSDLEKKYILEFQSFIPSIGYNLSMGGEGVNPNAETRAKLSASLRGRKWWEEQGRPHPRAGKPMPEKVRKAFDRTGIPPSEKNRELSRSRRGPLSATFGVPKTPEHRKKISDAHKGKRLTEETKKKIGDAGRGRVATEEAKLHGSLAKMGSKNPMFGKTGDKHPLFNKTITYEAIKPLLEKGMSTNKIASHFGVTRKVITHRIELEIDGKLG